jgi:hypothetical protein
MGIDYSAVGGIGVQLTKERIQKLIGANVFSQKEWEADYGLCLKKLKFPYSLAGDGSYTGEEHRYYLHIPGHNLNEINDNKEEFCKQFQDWNILLEDEDLAVLSDIYVF